ncbi:MAG: aminotransferase class I/II-fold pyridoxal phosphate-dependent enzyme [Planctomycetaceae bacterium]|nr:aminotransferase class I/II-fold pyridoxal phosphate-dependent enzyme [Planctomycetaceae bacterium]
MTPTPTIAADTLWLDKNEGPPLRPELMRRLLQLDGESLRRYPSRTALQSALARRFCVDADRVLVTAGGDDAFLRWSRAVLPPGQGVLLHEPTFGLIRTTAEAAGARVEGVTWLEGPFPKAAFAERMFPENGVAAPFALLVRPNNPTGRCVEERTLRELLDRAGRQLVGVDLAYGEYADPGAQEFALELAARDNTLLFGTFSKAYGLAGLRVGYAVGPREVIAAMEAAAGPYPVAGVALELAEAALALGPDRAHIDCVAVERDQLAALLESYGARCLASSANFVLTRPPVDALALARALRSEGVAVRSFAGDQLLAPWLRITCPGDRQRLERLGRALGAALAEVAR